MSYPIKVKIHMPNKTEPWKKAAHGTTAWLLGPPEDTLPDYLLCFPFQLEDWIEEMFYEELKEVTCIVTGDFRLK